MPQYEKIFAALKHPLRRRILLLLEEKGELSFTEIQNTVGIVDTGLLSYHLKELAPLIKQSARGKYLLSEEGRTSMALFRKVENEKQMSSTTVRKNIEKFVGEIFFLFFIIGIALMAPLSVDIYWSVQNISVSLSIEQMIVLFFAGLLGMIFGVILFIFYDRYYFSKNVKTNIVHSTIFAVGISLMSAYSIYFCLRFEEVASMSTNSVLWLFGILRTVSFLGSTPIIAYAICRLRNKR